MRVRTPAANDVDWLEVSLHFSSIVPTSKISNRRKKSARNLWTLTSTFLGVDGLSIGFFFLLLIFDCKLKYFPHFVVSSIQSVATRVVLPATVFIDVGTDFTIPCNTSGSPVATNKTWVQLEPNNNTVRIARDFLSFQGALSTNSGRYYCFADNGLTHDLQSTEVTVSCE